jgi:hypothetical protein
MIETATIMSNRGERFRKEYLAEKRRKRHAGKHCAPPKDSFVIKPGAAAESNALEIARARVQILQST